MKRNPALILLLLAAACATGHDSGLRVIDSIDEHRRLVAEEPENALVDLSTIHGIALEVRYATSDNFMGERLYPRPIALLRMPAARQLAAASRELASEGLGIRVFDAYRPYGVTVRMWERFRDPDYVADPKKGSRHNRGCAVDVTLYSLSTGESLPMPSGYDEFTPRAHVDFDGGTEEERSNRDRLRTAMERNGFTVLPSEWWHFDCVGWERFRLMDLPLEELAREAVGLDGE